MIAGEVLSFWLDEGAASLLDALELIYVELAISPLETIEDNRL